MISVLAKALQHRIGSNTVCIVRLTRQNQIMTRNTFIAMKAQAARSPNPKRPRDFFANANLKSSVFCLMPEGMEGLSDFLGQGMLQSRYRHREGPAFVPTCCTS